MQTGTAIRPVCSRWRSGFKLSCARRPAGSFSASRPHAWSAGCPGHQDSSPRQPSARQQGRSARRCQRKRRKRSAPGDERDAREQPGRSFASLSPRATAPVLTRAAAALDCWRLCLSPSGSATFCCTTIVSPARGLLCACCAFAFSLRAAFAAAAMRSPASHLCPRDETCGHAQESSDWSGAP